MTTLREAAIGYEAPKMLNIADLEWFPVDIEVREKEATDRDGQAFRYKFAVIGGKEYRIPGGVLAGLQEIFRKLPNTKQVCVTRTGQGRGTKYTVIPGGSQDGVVSGGGV